MTNLYGGAPGESRNFIPLRHRINLYMLDQIRTSLAGHRKRVHTEGEFTPAGVLIPLFYKKGELHLLFTKRTNTVASHKGQISFPGGAREEGDQSILATALRESEEEVGIRPADVEIIGELDDLITVSNFIVTPFVGMIPHPYDFKVSADEIEELIEIPLSFFMVPENMRSDRRPYRGKTVTVYFFDYGRHTVWGVTGHIMKGFIDLLRNGAPPR